jgi:hypothetical protein
MRCGAASAPPHSDVRGFGRRGDDTSSATQPRQSTVMLLSRPDRQQDASCAAHLILDWRASKDDIGTDRGRSVAAIMVFGRAGLLLSAERIIA